MTKIICVGDAHQSPEITTARFSRLGKLICDEKPDIVIQIGDLWDFGSMSAWDRGKAEIEGKRFNSDLDSGHNALDRMERIILSRKWGQEKWGNVKRYFTAGNHEFRVHRALQHIPSLDGFIDMNFGLPDRTYPWHVTPYERSVEIEGIEFSHCFMNAMGRPISGIHHSHQLNQKRMKASICGHSHLYDQKVATRGDEKVMSIVCGAFMEPWEVQFEQYAGLQNKVWDRGVLILDNVQDGQFDVRWIWMKNLIHQYKV